MIALTAYGIRKAYKKQQARKSRKEQLEKENQDTTITDPSDQLHSIPTSSSYRQSPDLNSHPVNGGRVSCSTTSTPSLNQVRSASPSRYGVSGYGQTSSKDPLEEMRQYRAYIQRQSYDFGTDANPPTYEFVVGQDIEATHPWKPAISLPARTEDPNQIRDAQHISQGPDRVVELDSSSESSRSTTIQQVPLRRFHPRSPIASDNKTLAPATELSTEIPEYLVSARFDDQQQACLDELVAEVPPPLRIRKSRETERFELPVDKVFKISSKEEGENMEDTTEPERQQLKRPRSESGSEIESEDNEQVIVRYAVADRTKRQYPKRKLGPDE